MFCIGLTGSIASGKSTVSQLFKEQGVAVISADAAARDLTQINQPALLAIEAHFGKSVLMPSGELNRTILRENIFADPRERIWLEQLLHPLIREYIESQLKELSEPYTIIEIPLLNDRKDYPYLNRVLLVLADREQQIIRVMNRDQCNRDQAESILAVQANEASRKELADDIIINNGSFTELEKKTAILHPQYLQFAGQKS